MIYCLTKNTTFFVWNAAVDIGPSLIENKLIFVPKELLICLVFSRRCYCEFKKDTLVGQKKSPNRVPCQSMG